MGLRVSITDLQQWKKRFYYNDNLFEGIGFELYENGKLKCELTYVEGQVNGICKEWDESGKLKSEGVKRISQHPENRFMDIEEFNGKYVEWFENGKIEKEEIWEDWTQKSIKTFFETGELESSNDGIKCQHFYISGDIRWEYCTIDKDKYSTFDWNQVVQLEKSWYENGQQEKNTSVYEFNNQYFLKEEWYENGQRSNVLLLEERDVEFELEWDENGKLVERYQSDSIKKDDYEKLITSLGNIDLSEIVKEETETEKRMKINKYSNLVIKRQTELWTDTEEDEDYSGFTYLLYKGEYNIEYDDWEVDDLSVPLDEIISIIHDDENKIVHHVRLDNDSDDYRWEIEYPTSETYYGPNEIDSMFSNDISKFGEELKKICDLPKTLDKYLD